jgi:ABC-type Fe3+/spermidine/putrescine transport system ATPase subunit
LRLVQLEERMSARPAELSGGEQQRVALARALVMEPLALLMDEPLSSLNPELRHRLQQEIVGLQEQLGYALLYVTHSREEAFEIGMRVVVMEQGRITRMGSADEIRGYF